MPVRRPTMVLALLVSLALGCAASNKYVQVAEAEGYTAVEPAEGGALKCGSNDMSYQAFTAKPPGGGPRVDGVVCCTLLGGCSVRH